MKIVVILFLLTLNNLHSQTVSDYVIFSKQLTFPKKFNFKDKKDKCVEQDINYLGEIKINGEKFKVLTSFVNICGKGVNDLVFVSANKEYIYRLNTPDDFPLKVINNELQFEVSGSVKTMKVEKLNDLFCTPVECFELVHRI